VIKVRVLIALKEKPFAKIHNVYLHIVVIPIRKNVVVMMVFVVPKEIV
jgi:hypothetical protein